MNEIAKILKQILFIFKLGINIGIIIFMISLYGNSLITYLGSVTLIIIFEALVKSAGENKIK